MKRVINKTLLFVIGLSMIACALTANVTISFDTNGGSEVQSITTDGKSAINLPDDPTKTGYTFAGWYLDDATYSDGFDANSLIESPVKNNIIVYAKWTINQYSISFNVNGGTDVAAIVGDYASSVTVPIVPTKTGHTFEGWYSDAILTTSYTFSTMPAENIILYAKWTINQYTITFNSNEGSSILALTQDYNSAILAPTVPTRTGYTFGGWYSDAILTTSYTFSTMPAENITLYAKWTINQYTMTFNSNEGTSVLTLTQDYNSVVSAPTAPTRTGYTFGGWYSDAILTASYTFSTMPAENITLYAKWTINQYYIGFNTNGGTAVLTITQDYATAVSTPAQPTKTGYTFSGWYSDAALTVAYTFTTMPAEDRTLYAKWLVNPYTITLVLDGGSGASTVIDEFGATLTTPTTVKTGHTFGGWYSDAIFTVAYTFTTMPSENITVYAKWMINQYTMTFNSNEGSSVTPLIQDYHSSVSVPPAPTRTGYTFGGWYSDDILTQAYTFSTMPAENITLYAKWTINQYTITFDSNDGSSVTPLMQDYHSSVSAPLAPTRTGYTFGGWYSDDILSAAYSFTTMPAENVTVYAKWTINQYVVEYVDHDGTILQTTTYEYLSNCSLNAIPDDPSRTGYTFTGWDGTVPLTMPASDVSITATYTVNQYTITFESNTGSPVLPIHQDYDSVIIVPDDPDKTGYSFTGWYRDELLTNLYAFSTMPAENLTLYAKWTINQYTISFDTNGGSAVASITLDYASSVSAPVDPTKAGFAFAGWYEDPELTDFYEFTTIPDEDITLYADWGTEGLAYVLVEESYVVSKGTANTSGAIVIPKRHDGILVTVIQEETFASTNITSLFIPSSIETIGIAAFHSNYYLKSVIFEAGCQILEIKNYTFWNATALETLVLPDSVLSIGEGAFGANGSLVDFVLPPNLVSIGYSAFTYAKLSSTLVLPSTLTTIGDYAFNSASGIDVLIIEIGSQLTSIGFHAFSGDNFTSISLPASVSSIDPAAFYGSGKLAEILVDQNNAFYSSTDGALFNKDGTVLIQYPAGNPASNYTVPSGVLTIGTSAFSSSTLTDILLPNTLLHIDNKAFSGLPYLVNVTFEAGSQLESIGESAFYNATSLSGITIPSSVQVIGQTAFYNAANMTYFTFETGSQLTTIGYQAFAGKDKLKSIWIPESVTSMGEEAFNWCWSLIIFVEADTIPSGWHANWNPFECAVLWGTEEVTENVDFKYALLSDNTAAILGITDLNVNTDIIIPDTIEGHSVTRIINEAFSHEEGIYSIHISSTVEEIGNLAFYLANHLSDVTFGAGSLLSYIGLSAFEGTAITSIILPDGLETVGNSVFIGCHHLTSIIIPISVVTMGSNVFMNISSLTINVEAASLPAGWDAEWNSTDLTVVWGYTPA